VTDEVRNKLFVELRTYHSSSHPSIVSFYGASYEVLLSSYFITRCEAHPASPQRSSWGSTACECRRVAFA
jgi:hypothetical protein